MRETEMPAAVLRWYDAHARDLPWRVLPERRRAGERPDPYAVWLSEIMLQQTTVAAVEGYYRRFLQAWPTIEALAEARDDDIMAAWAGLGYYARARNLLKCARLVCSEYGGRFPDSRDALLKLPGIGPYTAAAIAAIAFDRPETVVDGNVERVVARLFCIETPLPGAKRELAALASRLTPTQRPGDYAQAMMDLGAVVCTPTSPDCATCPLAEGCQGNRQGRAASLPRRAPRKTKPVRRGIAYVAQRTDGALLLERRPASGLLGGTLGWPGTDWNDNPAPHPPTNADWQHLGTKVRHTFTHFHLELEVALARVPDGAVPQRGEFVPRADFRPDSLPTVMRKVYHAAETTLTRFAKPCRTQEAN